VAEGTVKYKRVSDLVHGDVSSEYGAVTHREGRKVWFDNRVVTFNSAEEEIAIDHSVTAD
jgi:adenylosuccinate synthase